MPQLFINLIYFIMGAETIAAISLASLAFGTYASSAANKNNANIAAANNAMSDAHFKQSMQYNTNERLAAQEYNTNERLASQEFNAQQAKESRDFAQNMLLQQQKYMSPALQAERLREAGINPASVIRGDGDVSTLQSSPATSSPASISPASAPSIPARATSTFMPEFDAMQAQQSMMTVFNALDKKEDIKAKQTNNETLGLRNLAEIQKLKASIRNDLLYGNLTKAQTAAKWQEYRNLEVSEQILNNDLTIRQTQAKYANEKMLKELDAYDLAREKFKFEQDSTKIAQQLAERGMVVNEKLAQASIQKTMQDLRLMVKQGKKIDSEIALNRLERNGLVLRNSHQALENRRLAADMPGAEIESYHASRQLNSLKNENNIPAEAWKFIDQLVWYVTNTGASLLKYIK